MSLDKKRNSNSGLFIEGKLSLLFFVVVASLLLAGCQAGGKKMVQSTPVGDEEVSGVAATMTPDSTDQEDVLPEEESAGPVFLADIDSGGFDPLFVESRAMLYRTKADNWQVLTEKMQSFGISQKQEEQWQKCTGLLAELVGGYGTVLDGQGDPLAVIRKDISYAESACDEMFAVHTALIPELLAKFQQEAAGQAAAIVDYYAEKKDYHQVVAAYENAAEFSGEAPADLRLKEIYGRALLHIGRLEKAALVFFQVLVESGPYERWPLRLEAAELLIASGQYEKARAEYLHLAEILNSWEDINKSVTDQLALLFAADDHARELALYSQALQAYLSFAGDGIPNIFESAVRELQNTYPGGIHTSAAGRLYRQAEEKVRQNTALTLVQVEQFADAKEFKQALDILAGMKQLRLPADCMSQVDGMISAIRSARDHHIQLEKEKRVQVLADQWQEALNLVDMELYDDSITVFMELLGTDYDSKASVEIEKASLQAAKALRSKAAAVFVKARRATDPATRKALLKESRGILQSIMTRYPQVEIADKVVVNLQVIDEQLLELDGM